MKQEKKKLFPRDKWISSLEWNFGRAVTLLIKNYIYC